MTDDEARTVQQRVEGYLRSEDGRGFNIGNPQHFDRLVDRVRLSLPHAAEDDLRTATAMCWLGPKFAGIPPAAMRDKLLDILRRLVPDEQERLGRVMEFAIAYGCGKWRRAQEGYGGWEQQWEGAVRGLVRALEPAVNESNRWLTGHVVGFPNRGNSDVSSDAHLLAMRLKHPERPLHLEREETMSITCTDEGTELVVSSQNYQKTVPPGAKAVFTVTARELRAPPAVIPLPDGAKVIVTARDDEARIEVVWNAQRQRVRLRVGETATIPAPATLTIWECSCGNVHCAERHRLEAWDPTQVSLWAFVASAVKGPQPGIQTGSFVQGMYFPLLAQEGW